ncbi:hypothetical protein GpartN1_g4038.t1 [Galdieria partita]|uniref:Acetate transporter n=1 Tax=Galdieria partita TaxID=83374 RepID=A0A9C7UR83_9RHOD|nr:hypothetical protein GpartN1_g4038.t1 [Galdieria partita]
MEEENGVSLEIPNSGHGKHEYEKISEAVHKNLTSRMNSAPFPPFPDPTSLGLSGFSCTTFILSVLNAKLLPSKVIPGVVGPGLFYGGTVQMLAGLLCFITRNMFGLVAFTSFGAFWLAVSTLITLEEEGILVFGTDANQVLGILLVGYSIFSTYLWIASFAHHFALVFTITALILTLMLLAMANFGVMSTVPGGICGIILAAGGWYISAGVLINDNYGRTVVPFGDIHCIPYLNILAPKKKI